MEISRILQIQKGVTAIIGGGGKTTLMLTLAQALSRQGRVIVTTSTRIFPPEGIPVVFDRQEAENLLRQVPVVCLASPAERGKLGPPQWDFESLAALADYVLVEADGSKGLPLKAHAAHEPVIPAGSNQVICVVGADSFGKPVAQVCHRPELYAALIGGSPQTVVSPELAAEAIQKEGFAARIYINKAESAADWDNAARFAAAASCPVAAGSLWKGEYQCLS